MRLSACCLLMTWMMTGNAYPPDQPDLVPLPNDRWRLVTDAVMGGVSSGRIAQTMRGGRACVCLSGAVSTHNNGGFIQLALDLDDRLAALAVDYDGIQLEVMGNGEPYNLHLRTRDLWLPWQSYRAGFLAGPEWQTLRLPFSGFEPYRSRQPLRVERLKRIGLVAIGRDFEASVCVAGLAFYRERD